MQEVLGKIPTGLFYKDNKTDTVTFANEMALNVFDNKILSVKDRRMAME